MIHGVMPTSADTMVRDLLRELQGAVRDKDHAEALDLFTEDAALLGTSANNLSRSDVSGYVTKLFSAVGYLRWDWTTVSALDVRPGAVTFVALGSVGFEGDPQDDSRDPIRLTCLAVDDGDRWRLRLFHGSTPAV